LSEGFFVSPFARDLREVAALFGTDQPAASVERVVSIRFHTDKPGQFRAAIPIVWSRLPEN
jgi:hypothetical protein